MSLAAKRKSPAGAKPAGEQKNNANPKFQMKSACAS
jgi:hypothetical protein